MARDGVTTMKITKENTKAVGEEFTCPYCQSVNSLRVYDTDFSDMNGVKVHLDCTACPNSIYAIYKLLKLEKMDYEND